MKKLYNRSGEFLGTVKKAVQLPDRVEVECQPDFPGMIERTEIYRGCAIIYEDAKRIYIDH